MSSTHKPNAPERGAAYSTLAKQPRSKAAHHAAYAALARQVADQYLSGQPFRESLESLARMRLEERVHG